MKKHEKNRMKLEIVALAIIIIVVGAWYLMSGNMVFTGSNKETGAAQTEPGQTEPAQTEPAQTGEEASQEPGSQEPEKTTTAETQEPGATESVGTAFYLRDYPDIEATFAETGKNLEEVLTGLGYAITNIERSKDVRTVTDGNATYVPDENIRNYVFAAVDVAGLTNETIYDEGFRVSDEIVPYMKSYYTDSEIWMILLHDSCQFSGEVLGVLCTFSTWEIGLNSCMIKQPTQQECYGG